MANIPETGIPNNTLSANKDTEAENSYRDTLKNGGQKVCMKGVDGIESKVIEVHSYTAVGQGAIIYNTFWGLNLILYSLLNHRF